MSETVIRTTIDDLPHALPQYAGKTPIEVRVLDTTDEHPPLKALIQESLGDPRPNTPAEDVFAAARERIREKLKAPGGN